MANSSPVIHQTLRRQGGTRANGHIHLAVWTLRVAAMDKRQLSSNDLSTQLVEQRQGRQVSKYFGVFCPVNRYGYLRALTREDAVVVTVELQM